MSPQERKVAKPHKGSRESVLERKMTSSKEERVFTKRDMFIILDQSRLVWVVKNNRMEEEEEWNRWNRGQSVWLVVEYRDFLFLLLSEEVESWIDLCWWRDGLDSLSCFVVEVLSWYVCDVWVQKVFGRIRWKGMILYIIKTVIYYLIYLWHHQYTFIFSFFLNTCHKLFLIVSIFVLRHPYSFFLRLCL